MNCWWDQMTRGQTAQPVTAGGEDTRWSCGLLREKKRKMFVFTCDFCNCTFFHLSSKATSIYNSSTYFFKATQGQTFCIIENLSAMSYIFQENVFQQVIQG